MSEPHTPTHDTHDTRRNTMTDTETCDICNEKIDYCTCHRCFTCEQLFSEDVEMGTDDNGEGICPSCEGFMRCPACEHEYTSETDDAGFATTPCPKCGITARDYYGDYED